MVQSPPLRRDMSHRKPVPVYVPSPRSSPDLPQLPINPKISDAHQAHTVTLCASESELPEILLSTPKDASDSSTLNRPTENAESSSYGSVYSQSTTARLKHGLPQTYRPPTPPLASNKKRKIPEDNRDFLTVPPVTQQGVRDSYFPPVPGFRTQPSPPGSPQTLSPQQSFQTEKTLVSTHSAPEFRYSTWQSTRPNQTTDQWHDLPVLPMHVIKPRRGSGSIESSSSKAASLPSARKWWLHKKWSSLRSAVHGCLSTAP
ncbi:hypothetical protein D9758_008885 [Tetrapyrgos nigripes]|uniref:Uncharacterized protein n=1 Tax=Tetrapyrgos nigripes TaxID=182062 RepID=A0A8H5CNJ6_9AGAR|nr:hypothetical protein D9758_008885 [Tetrapyrgos nigripes]